MHLNVVPSRISISDYLYSAGKLEKSAGRDSMKLNILDLCPRSFSLHNTAANPL